MAKRPTPVELENSLRAARSRSSAAVSSSLPREKASRNSLHLPRGTALFPQRRQVGGGDDDDDGGDGESAAGTTLGFLLSLLRVPPCLEV